jgi:hypothetical protein
VPKPKVFIASSGARLDVARLIADGLEQGGCAEAVVWDEGVFNLNYGILEKLLEVRDEYDFAVMVWGADDVTQSKGETTASARDNVIFECGFFMAALGRERVFVVRDRSAEVKIPSDLAGLTLATFDGKRAEGEHAEGAVREACRLISKEISGQWPHAHLVGKWKSKYLMPYEAASPVNLEDLEISLCRDGLSLNTTYSPHADDYYTAFGRMVSAREMCGQWKSKEGLSNMCGAFVLTVGPSPKYMYGYFTVLNEKGVLLYAYWVLAKSDGADEAKVAERLRRAEAALRDATLLPEAPAAAPPVS